MENIFVDICKEGRQVGALLKSMTGYGRGEAANADYRLTIEIKAVNHRFLEISVRLPKQLNPLEDTVKKAIQGRLNRGKVDVFISLEETESKRNALKVDTDLAIVYYKALVQVADCCQISPTVDARTVALFPGVVSLEKEEADLEALVPVLDKALNQALAALLAMREAEGASLQADLLLRNRNITALVDAVRTAAPDVAATYAKKLRQRMEELLGEVILDEARLANEVAFFADKSDISEELARMESHLRQFEGVLGAGESIGRKLEFILQEMNREINTIGSKANDLFLSQQVIEAKSELEKMREQVQNVE